jgi:hypothetical protein
MTDGSIRSKPTEVTLARLTMARAVVVALGPSAILDATCLVATGMVVRQLIRRPSRRPASPIAATIIALLAAFPWVYFGLLRPWHRRWGASVVEQRKPLPGDELVPTPAYQHTRAVTVNAPIHHVWKWLVQIGQDRGGLYSYDWLENVAGCGIHSAERIHEEWQHPRVGDTLAIVRGWGPRILAIDPGRSLVIEGWGTYALEPIDANSTRLIARARQPRGWPTVWYALLIEIPHFIMERKMLLRLRDRAERSASRTALDHVLPQADYAGSVSVKIRATPAAIFKALREVTLDEMPVAHALGSIRYLPGRLAGRMQPATNERSRPFFDLAARLVLAEEPGREVVIGSVGRLHDLIDQDFVDLDSAEAFERFQHPNYEKHAESFRITGGNAETGYTLLAEHRTQALGAPASWKFALYWYLLVGWSGNLLLRMLLKAVKRRAERMTQ